MSAYIPLFITVEPDTLHVETILQHPDVSPLTVKRVATSESEASPVAYTATIRWRKSSDNGLYYDPSYGTGPFL